MQWCVEDERESIEITKHAEGSRCVRDRECYVACRHVPSLLDLGSFLGRDRNGAIWESGREHKRLLASSLPQGQTDVASDTRGRSLTYRNTNKFALPGLASFEHPRVSQNLITEAY